MKEVQEDQRAQADMDRQNRKRKSNNQQEKELNKVLN
jgi:hypothetical protein